MVIQKFSSFEEAEAADVKFYAHNSWKKSVAIVNDLIKQIWSNPLIGVKNRKFSGIRKMMKNE